jgi:antitoxin ParD1/3/4
MTTLQINLPDSMQSFVQEKVAAGGYSTMSDYIQALIGEDRKRAATERLEAAVVEGLNSGEAEAMTEVDWEELRRRVDERRARGTS